MDLKQDNINVNEQNTKENQIRRVQALTGDRSFTFVLPKSFAVELGIGKGDFFKVSHREWQACN
jgi:hypothetical protein